jgi:curved DNA-binding protein CbpA
MKILYSNFVRGKNSIYKICFKSISFKKLDIIEGNYYHILGVNFDSDYESIKQSYYNLAKKYHPDINPSAEALEKFKKIKKAYEVLGDPNLRISYDIEHGISDANESENRRDSDERYTSKYGKRVMRGPRTVKNFYWDKWSNFKTPKWSNLKSGLDYKAEYMHRTKDDYIDKPLAHSRFLSFLEKYRLIWFILFIFSVDLITIYKNYGLYKTYKMFKDTFFLNEKIKIKIN